MKHFRSEWIRIVWQNSLDTGRGFTPGEACGYFGTPQANVTAQEFLEEYARDGFFRREKWTETIGGTLFRRCRYFAIQPQLAKPQPPDRTSSYFGHMPRVRSVFELGGAL